MVVSAANEDAWFFNLTSLRNRRRRERRASSAECIELELIAGWRPTDPVIVHRSGPLVVRFYTDGEHYAAGVSLRTDETTLVADGVVHPLSAAAVAP